jgi:enoyl-[acyl-carrier protein] reductase/trans-2-enoyl-CoA reductase (NAD+)
MIIKPKIRGFICTTTHPTGCEVDVQNQINYVRNKGRLSDGPKKVLVIGASGGYGLASRISSAFGYGAASVGVFLERSPQPSKTGSPGWYRTAAFSRRAEDEGIYCANINGDAFSKKIKDQVCDLISRDLGQVDLVVYSLAAPTRTLSDGGLARSALKPIGSAYDGLTVDLNTKEIRNISLESASDVEIKDTIKVMGGEDWEIWIEELMKRDLLARGFITTNYTYIGSEVTWPIYNQGTIGRAKEDLERAARAISKKSSKKEGTAYLAVMKGLVTQAASAIPGMSVYLSLLFKIMKDKNLHEGCIEQAYRLFSEELYSGANINIDQSGRIRLDTYELLKEVQEYVSENWSNFNIDTMDEIADFEGYRKDFMKIYGFDFENVDYDEEVSPDSEMTLYP